MVDNVSVRRLVFVQKAPTPYNDYLFRAIANDARISVHVKYLWKTAAGRPWKSALGHGYSCDYMRQRLGIDWQALRLAALDRDSLWIVGDWAHAATVALILVRLMRRMPVGLRVDTPQEQLPRRQPKKWLRQRFLRWLLRQCGFILATSEPAFRALEKMGAVREKLVDFPFYVPLTGVIDTTNPHWIVRKRALRASVGCSDKGIVFCMVGMMISKKGMDIGMRAFASFVRQHSGEAGMLIAGDGPQRTELQGLASQLCIESRVRVLGWQEPEALEETMLASNALIHPARFDPFPVVVLDAMRLGLPVIGSDACGSVIARVRSGENGLVFPTEDLGALESALRRIGENPSCLLDWGVEARRTAEMWPVSRGVETIWRVLEAEGSMDSRGVLG